MTAQRSTGRTSVAGIIAFALLAALLLTLAVLSTVKGVRTAESAGNVVRVVDGQTVVVNLDGSEETVTLAGVMAPRPAGEGQEPTVDNCLGQQSSDNLSGMLAPGVPVQVQFTGDADGPDDTRPALLRSGGRVANIEQVEAGLAVPLREQPMAQHGTELEDAQNTAREESNGLYSPDHACTLPGRVAPVIALLNDLPGTSPSTAEEAGTRIETVSEAVEQGVAAEKQFDTVDPEASSLASLAWAEDVPRLREQLNDALADAQVQLASLESSRGVLQAREREETERREEEARQAELARQEAARQEAARQEAARQQAARREAARETERRAERESRPSEQSATPTRTPTPSPTAEAPVSTPTPTRTTTPSPTAEAPASTPTPTPTPTSEPPESIQPPSSESSSTELGASVSSSPGASADTAASATMSTDAASSS